MIDFRRERCIRSFLFPGTKRVLIFMFSVSEVFPVISFNFEGIASMVLKPEEYLQFDSIVSCSTILSAHHFEYFCSCTTYESLNIELWQSYNAKHLNLAGTCFTVHRFSESRGWNKYFRRLNSKFSLEFEYHAQTASHIFIFIDEHPFIL